MKGNRGLYTFFWLSWFFSASHRNRLGWWGVNEAFFFVGHMGLLFSLVALFLAFPSALSVYGALMYIPTHSDDSDNVSHSHSIHRLDWLTSGLSSETHLCANKCMLPAGNKTIVLPNTSVVLHPCSMSQIQP